jgi:sulfatase-modifying factor enzyme 1
MLYELIANRHPHSRPGDTMFAMLSRMQTSLPPPIQAFRDVPPQIATFLDRALARDPRQRFATWDAFVAELPTVAAIEILEAMPLPPERDPPESLAAWHDLPDDHLERVAIPRFEPAPPPPAYHAAMDEFEYGDDGRPMLACGALLVDARPVTAAEYQRFVLAMRGRLDPEADDAPCTGVSQRDAARYAAWAGKRLPTAPEWRFVTSELGRRLQTGEVWEWTATPADQGGFVVCGGRWRNASDQAPELTNRSFEVGSADDVGFRCVQLAR